MPRPLLFLLLLAPAAVAQPASVDRVVYRGKDGKLVTTDAEVKESVAGVQLLVAGKPKDALSPADIVRIDYGTLPGLAKADLSAVQAFEDGRDPAKAAAAFAALAKKAGPQAGEKTRRYLAFREAVWAVKAADTKTGDEFAAEAKPAADKLAGVFRASKKGWEAWPAARTAARVYAELDDFDAAAKLLAELAAVPDLPADLRADAKLAEAANQIRGRRSLEAEGTLARLAADPALPASAKDKLAVLTAAARVPLPKPGEPTSGQRPAQLAELQKAVDAAGPGAKAVGYGLLGEACLANGLVRDAMWAFLWVDTVHNQEADERVLAVRRLAAVFDRQGEKERADQFREKLPRVR
jgi:hypothetical protein